MLDELRDRVSSILSRNHVCVISTNGSHGAWAAVATYENKGLLLNCRLPRWSEAAFFLEQEPDVLAIILDGRSGQLRWLLYRGVAHLAAGADDRFVPVCIAPKRIDLVDESMGWGILDTLEM